MRGAALLAPAARSSSRRPGCRRRARRRWGWRRGGRGLGGARAASRCACRGLPAELAATSRHGARPGGRGRLRARRRPHQGRARASPAARASRWRTSSCARTAGASSCSPSSARRAATWPSWCPTWPPAWSTACASRRRCAGATAPGLRFSRPVRWVVAKLDEQTVPFELHGLTAGDVSQGHRFLGGPAMIGDARGLRRGAAGRRRGARPRRPPRGQSSPASTQAAAAAGGAWSDPGGKLEEVVFLVEWPSVITGRFDDRHLRLPPRVLVTAMQGHQRYFPLRGRRGRAAARLPRGVERRPGPRRRHHPRQRGACSTPACRTPTSASTATSRPAWRPSTPASTRSSSTSASAPWPRSATASSPGSATLADAAGRRRRRPRPRPSTPRAWRRPTRAPCWWPSSPSSRATSPPSTRAARASPRTWRSAVEEHYLPEGPDSPLPSGEAGALVAAAEKFDNLVGAFAVDEAPDRLEGPLRPAPRGDRAGADRPRPRLGLRPGADPAARRTRGWREQGADLSVPTARAPSTRSMPSWPTASPTCSPRRASGAEAAAAAIGAGLGGAPATAAWARAIDAERRDPGFGPRSGPRRRAWRASPRKGPAEDEAPAPPGDDPGEAALRDATARPRGPASTPGARRATCGRRSAAAAPLAEAVDRFFVDVLVNADDPGVRARRYGLVRAGGRDSVARGRLRAGHRRRRGAVSSDRGGHQAGLRLLRGRRARCATCWAARARTSPR